MIFDIEEAKERREEGIGRASEARKELLRIAREGVRLAALTRESREATADDAQKYLVANGYRSTDLGNAAGAIFSCSEWEFTGQWRESERVTNHAHKNRVWRLKETLQ